MESPELNAETLVTLMQAIFADHPFGLLLLDEHGRPMWFNREAALVCAIWNHGERTGSALRLESGSISVPAILAETSALLLAKATKSGQFHAPGTEMISDASRGLHARVKLVRSGPDRSSAFYIQLDYRRPRSDRERPLSAEALALYSRLTEREREVALRVRDGLSTREIATELRRSPLTIKTQLAAIFTKLGIRNRARVAAILNR